MDFGTIEALSPTPRLPPYGQKTHLGHSPQPELIALRTLMINQAREIFCQGKFPSSLIDVLIAEPVAYCPVDFYAASLS